MNEPYDASTLDTILYPFQICGIFRTPVRPSSDYVVYTRG
jgi:hypothetical protein